VARRSTSGGGAVLGFLLLLGLVIQVVKLLVVPLTILAIGAVVVVPVYLVTKSRRDAPAPPPVAEPKAVPADDGIVSQEAVLDLLPTDLAAQFTYPERPDPGSSLRPSAAVPPGPSSGPRKSSGDGGYRHGSCAVRHRSSEAAARCRNP
jgi:hypothetical protein